MFAWRSLAPVSQSLRRAAGHAAVRSSRVHHVMVAPQMTRTAFVARGFSTKGNTEEAQVENEVVDVKAEVETTSDADKVPEASEKGIGEAESQPFKAETSRILDIVANSLYTDKEVFLREIISNASDALEKARYMQTMGDISDSEKPFEIHVITDEAKNTITIQDSGCGMSKPELIENIGTIAKSGSKEFVKNLDAAEGGSKAQSNIIGQFGVGFYSTLMVGDKIDIYSKSADVEKGKDAHYWTSDGEGNYSISKAEGVTRGTKIVVHLKKRCKEFAVKHMIEGIIKKYSNFVGFPIFLNGAKINTVDAIWAKNKNSVTEEEHKEFYRYVANAYDEPFYKLHFSADAPIQINGLFYFPERHMEKYGMGKSESGVSLYSRKVLIQAKAKTVLPEWLRFVKGVVDSEDIPLNISRENMQDSALLARINNALTRRLIKYMAEEAKKDSTKYLKFYNEFGNFLKEGTCTDFKHKNEIAGLLRFETSISGENELFSLDEYISRMPPEQKGIYYLNAPSREFALSSPYFESFDKKGTEVLFLFSHIDDFVMKNLGEYQKRKFLSVEGSALDDEESKSEKSEDEKKQSDSDIDELVAFFKDTLNDKVYSIKPTTRLSSTPAIVVDHESSSMRKMMKYVDPNGDSMGGAGEDLPKQKLEINPEHPVMKKILANKDKKADLTKLVVEQVFDNALIAADLVDNPRTMLTRLNKLLDAAL